MQASDTFGNYIHFNQLIVEKFNSGLANNLFKFNFAYSNVNHNQVTFTNCVFRYNKIGRLFGAYGHLNIKLESCIFKFSHFQVLQMIDSSKRNSMVITNTTFYAIKTNSYFIHISNSLINLEGPVFFLM